MNRLCASYGYTKINKSAALTALSLGKGTPPPPPPIFKSPHISLKQGNVLVLKISLLEN